MRFITLVFAALGLCGSTSASQVITLDPETAPTEPSAPVRAIVTGEKSGLRCVLRLELRGMRGIVRGASACPQNEALRRSKFWLRSAQALSFYSADDIRLIAFERTADDVFRAAGVRPESLRLRLLPMASIPMKQ